MKIANFISGKDLGGPKQSFLLYNEALKILGHSVIPIIRKGAQFKELIIEQKLHPIEINYIRSLNILIKKRSTNIINNSIKSIAPDIIFVHKQLDIELTRIAIGDSSIPIIGVIHGFNAKHIDCADALIAVSNKIKIYLEQNNYKKPIYVIPNMVKIDTTPLQKRFSPIPTIGSMGIFRRKKGFHILIKALSILHNRGVNFKAIIAGRGKRVIVYKYMRSKYNLSNILTFKSWIPNEKRDDFFNSIDIYVLPSRTESFGMVVVEAMAHKKFTIATKCGGPEEIIEHNRDGILVEKENPLVLANALEDMILNNPNYQEMQNSAYLKAKTYSVDNLKDNLKYILKEFKI